MTTLLVTSTADGTGKTAISIALAHSAQEKGASVGYMKPKGTRLESAVGKTRDEDPMLARELLDLDAAMHELEPVVYSPTFVREAILGREDPAALRERIADSFEALSADRDVMVVEGGGRLWTGGIVDLTDADVAELLDAEVVLVSSYDDPMDLDDVLAAADRVGERLAGVLFNPVRGADFDALTEDVAPFLEGRGIETLGALPFDETLAGVSVADLAEGIGADLVTSDAPTDGLIERFSVGAMGSGSALEPLRRTRNAALITGGDRSDIQTTALEASGVECLVLTGGYRPSKTVVGKAEDRGVPLLSVQTDTRTTIDRVEESLQSDRIRDPEAVVRMGELLSEGVDVDALLSVEE
jgi:BioD-like phosphotransacetylase family protein